MTACRGFLVPPDDVGALVGALARLLSSPALRETVGRGGREAYEASFTVERMAEEAERFYEALARVPAAA